MADNFTRTRFDRLFNVEHIITIFYMELSKSFYHDEEQHDFWEIVYIDKGEMLCSANGNRYILKSGEMTFHKPHESHNLTGINDIASNVSILTFQCNSRAMKHFEGKIFRLNAEEKSLLAELFSEGLSCYQLMDARNPLLQKLKKVTPSPLGSSQMTKNLLEIFLIKLCRNTDVVTKKMRRSYMIDGVDVPYEIKKLLDYLQEHIYSNVTIGELARHLDKSESAVKQLFARFRDGGIIKYYTELKIKEARKLIREGSYNMTQISDMLQFDTPQYFSKCFKRVTNMTPTEYKDSILK
jgi:AraC-like DNA-binding protein